MYNIHNDRRTWEEEEYKLSWNHKCELIMCLTYIAAIFYANFSPKSAECFKTQ